MQSNVYLINLFHILVNNMKTFRDKHFKNKIDPKVAYYDCIRTCELNISNKQGVEILILNAHFH